MMTEADKVSELHQEVKNSLLNEDLEKVKNWQKDAYHKQIMGGFKETKEAEDGFRKAQKPWAKKMKEVPVRALPGMGVAGARGCGSGATAFSILGSKLVGGPPHLVLLPSGPPVCPMPNSPTAGSSQEGLPPGLQRGEAGHDPGDEQQDRAVGHP